MADKTLNFKVGMDDADAMAGFKRIENGANQAATVISTKMRNAMAQASAARNSIGGSTGGGFNPGVRVAGDAINALTGGRGAVMELRALEGLTGASLGVAAAAVIAYKSWEAYSESIKKVRELSDEAAKSINANITALGPEAITKKIDENTTLADKLKESRGFASNVNSFFGGSANRNSLKEEAKLRREATDQLDKERDYIKGQTAEKERLANASERQVKISKIATDLEEKKAKIQTTMAPGLRDPLIRQAESEAKIQTAAIEHQMDLKDQELSLETQIASIRNSNAPTLLKEQSVYKAKIEAAKEEAKSALNPDEKAAAVAKQATLEADMAEKQQARVKQLRAETKALRIASDKETEQAETEAFKKEAKLRAEFAQKVHEDSNRKRIEDAEKVAKDINDQVSSYEAQRSAAISTAQSDPHHVGVALRRAARQEARNERLADRALGITPKDRAFMNEVQKIANAGAKNIEARIRQADMDKLLAGIGQLIAK